METPLQAATCKRGSRRRLGAAATAGLGDCDRGMPGRRLSYARVGRHQEHRDGCCGDRCTEPGRNKTGRARNPIGEGLVVFSKSAGCAPEFLWITVSDSRTFTVYAVDESTQALTPGLGVLTSSPASDRAKLGSDAGSFGRRIRDEFCPNRAGPAVRGRPPITRRRASDGSRRWSRSGLLRGRPSAPSRGASGRA